MAQRINADTAKLFSQYRVNTERIKKTVEQLATGNRINKPGDEVVNFERASFLSLDRSAEFAQMKTIQSRLNWYNVSTGYLSQINDILKTMSELSIHAKSGTATEGDYKYLDAVFQEFKEQISNIVDGQGGSKLPLGTFGDVPIFLDYSPGTAVGPHDLVEDPGVKSVNMYTGYNRDGFTNLPLLTMEDLENTPPSVKPTLTGTATAGTTTTIVLEEDASHIHDVYVGTTITITGGTGAGQAAQIIDYDGITRVATLEATLPTALDNTSEYSIDSGKPNVAILAIGGISTVRFAEHIWGADNDRLDHLSKDIETFRALTEEERAFRSANSIPDTDLEPRTNAEKLMRRQLNIFDPEFGNIRNSKNADAMLGQLENAINQVSLAIAREDSKAEALKSQYNFFDTLRAQQHSDIENAKGVDFAQASVDFNQLTVAHGMIFEIAQRISENFSLLTDLVKQ